MEEAFETVLWIVVVAAALIGLFTLAGSAGLYDQIGRGGIGDERDAAPREPALETPAGRAIAEEEIRQMLEARNERRARRGEAPLDVEAELARLTATAPAHADPALAEEVRQLVVARNERRMRRGEEPLDVDAEVRRQLEELGGA